MHRWIAAAVVILSILHNGCIFPDSGLTDLGAASVEINSGHQDAVTSMQYCEERGLLFTASKDGTLKIWDNRKGIMVHSLVLSHLPISRISVHPSLPLVALLEVIGTDTSILSVWNWDSRKLLYRHQSAQVPIYLTFSPKGTYLIECLTDFQSLRIFDSLSGEKLQLMDQGFGIVSFVTLSSSEKNIMTYQPSGRIIYWELDTGSEIKTVDTLANLSMLQITKNKRNAFASTNQNLVVVDLLTGELKTSSELPGILSLVISAEGDRVTCLVKNEKGTNLSEWIFTGNYLYKTNGNDTQKNLLPDGLINLAGSKDNLYMGDETGRLWLRSSDAGIRLFAQNTLMEISSIGVHNGVLTLGGPDGISIFRLDVKTFALNSADIISGYSFESYNNPFSTPIGLEYSEEGTLFIWDKSDQLEGITTLNTFLNTFKPVITTTQSALLQLSLQGDKLITLERNGLMKILDSATYNSLFEYLSPGMRKVVYAGENILIGARGQVTDYSKSLIRINTRTGETFPLQDANLLSYDLVFDYIRNRLYTLSLSQSSGRIITSVKEHSEVDFQKSRVLVEYGGEDLSASLAFDPFGNRLYTSLGYDSVQEWDGTSLFAFQKGYHLPRELKILERLLVSRNRDSTITIWDRQSRQILVTLYIFQDRSWIALFPNENAYMSWGADRYLVQP